MRTSIFAEPSSCAKELGGGRWQAVPNRQLALALSQYPESILRTYYCIWARTSCRSAIVPGEHIFHIDRNKRSWSVQSSVAKGRSTRLESRVVEPPPANRFRPGASRRSGSKLRTFLTHVRNRLQWRVRMTLTNLISEWFICGRVVRLRRHVDLLRVAPLTHTRHTNTHTHTQSHIPKKNGRSHKLVFVSYSLPYRMGGIFGWCGRIWFAPITRRIYTQACMRIVEFIIY